MAPLRAVDDPFTATAVYVFGQLYVAVGPMRRIAGVGIYSGETGTFLVALPGRSEYEQWRRAQLANQNARRARARGGRDRRCREVPA